MPLRLDSHISPDFQPGVSGAIWGLGLGLKENSGHTSLFLSTSNDNVTPAALGLPGRSTLAPGQTLDLLGSTSITSPVLPAWP